MKVILIASQKGGVGKSTLNTIIPTALYNTQSYNVATIDGDLPQFSLYNLREREKQVLNKEFQKVKEDGNYSSILVRKFSGLVKKGKQSYKVFRNDILDIPDTIKKMKKNDEFDFLFIDIVGSINTEGYEKLFKYVDFLIIPVAYDSFEIESTLGYLKTLPKELPKNILFNQVKSFDKHRVNMLKDTFNKNGIKTFQTSIPDAVRYKNVFVDTKRKDALRSTIFYQQDDHIDKFIEEFIQKIQII